MLRFIKMLQGAWRQWRATAGVDKEERMLRELKRQLETRREQLESLKRMREELEAHEKAQFEAAMSRMLEQQERSAPRSSSVDVAALDPTFLRREEGDADSTRSAPSTSGPNAIETEMNAMMDLLGSRSFTILGEGEGNSKGAPNSRQQRVDRAKDEEDQPP